MSKVKEFALPTHCQLLKNLSFQGRIELYITVLVAKDNFASTRR